MSGKDLPVIQLNERSLQRLHEKFKRLKSEGKIEVKKEIPKRQQSDGKKTREKPEPKFQVYQAGVTRLSNREPTLPPKNQNIEKKPQREDREPQSRPTRNSVSPSKTQSSRSAGRVDTRRRRTYDQEEKQDFTSEQHHEESDDNELEWDDYNHSRFFTRRRSSSEDDEDFSLDKEEEETMNHKRLFDPSNPETPIMVKPGRRNERHHMMTPPQNPKTLLRPTERGFQHERNPEVRSTVYSNTTWQQREMLLQENLTKQEFREQRKSFSSPQTSSELRLMNDQEKCENFIKTSISTCDFTKPQYVDKLQKARYYLMEKYKSILLSDISSASKNNIEQILWRNIFHQVIEKLREQISTDGDSPKLRNLLLSILDQAGEFYDALLLSLQHVYRFDLNDILSSLSIAKSIIKSSGKKTKLGILCSQKCLLCLGDISRYKENAYGTMNYGRARRYYVQARCVDPRNGRPYNQLAILAVQTRRRLDAVYYYIRSLTTSGSPILTARESLASLFNEAHRKLEVLNTNETKSKEKQLQEKPKETKKTTRELWIFPNRSVENTKEDLSKKDDFEPVGELKPSEILKKLILYFLNVHGKLFTRVGVDSFTSAKNKTLQLFDKVLKLDSSFISETLLFQLFAVNFFSVDNQIKKSSDGAESLLEPALTFVFSMMSLIVDRINLTVMSYSSLTEALISNEMNVLLPIVKLCSDWMYVCRDVWYPNPPHGGDSSPHKVWDSLAKMCDWVCDDQLHLPVEIYSNLQHYLSQVNLPEDHEFAGFIPLIKNDNDSKFALEHDLEQDRKLVLQCVRLTLIQDFLGYLCGMERPLLAFKKGRYVVLVQQSIPHDGAIEPTYEVKDDWGGEDVYDLEGEYTKELSPLDGAISDLQALHVTLQRTKFEQEKRKSRIQASLHAQHQNEEIIKIKPSHIIPDTNCFIDYLDIVGKLIDCNQFTICLPLVVVSELEGLSNEVKGHDPHALEVRHHAAKACVFVEKKFKERNSRVVAVTNQGNTLDTVAYKTQQHSSDKGKNDDLILKCCKMLTERRKDEDDGIRSVVLLTDDRNLRVKSMANNIPTLSIQEFCKLASLT